MKKTDSSGWAGARIFSPLSRSTIIMGLLGGAVMGGTQSEVLSAVSSCGVEVKGTSCNSDWRSLFNDVSSGFAGGSELC